MYPCPCGWYGDPSGRCTANAPGAPSHITRHQNRIGGPVLDRIDIHVDVPRVECEKLSGSHVGEPSTNMRARMEQARRAGCERIQTAHMAEAIQYRQRKL